MSENKNILSKLFGKKEKGGCCSMEIVEETESEKSCCQDKGSADCGYDGSLDDTQ